MRIAGNPIFRSFTCEACAYYTLRENNKTYKYNRFMEYWENIEDGKFYRWLTDKDKQHMKELEEYYYNSLDF